LRSAPCICRKTNWFRGTTPAERSPLPPRSAAIADRENPGGPDVFSTKEKRWHGIGARNDRTLMTATVVCGMAGAAYGLLSSHTFADAILGALVVNDPYAELNQIDQRGPKEPKGSSAATPARAHCGRWDGRARPQIARTHLSRSKQPLRRMNRPSASWKAWQRIIGGWPISKIASRTRNNDNCAGFASLPWGQALCGSRCGSPRIAGAYRPGRDCQRRVVNLIVPGWPSWKRDGR
jgi:hypothetical protein